MSKPIITVLHPETGDEFAIPAKFEVCPRCHGEGSQVNPAIDGNGLTAEDIDEAGPEFLDDYLSGVYDVPCHQCKGERVVAVPDMERLNDEQRTAYENHSRALADLERDSYYERRAEAWACGERF